MSKTPIELYNKVNNFELGNGEYVFMDMFCRNRELVLICSFYIDTKLLSVVFNKTPLIVKEKYEKDYEKVIILIFDLPVETTNMIDITVTYSEVVKQYSLQYTRQEKKYKLVLSTLFKDDYDLLDKFINYYKLQGVEHFYLYYNGDISNLKIDKTIADVTFIEWDYNYWIELGPHYAQPGQIHDSLYKYGIPLSDYMIFNDLDEYMYIENRTIIDYIIENPNVDTIMFLNRWADTNDEYYNNSLKSIEPLKKIIVDKKILQKNNRSKCIHKTDSVNMLHIHHCHTYNKKVQSPNVKNFIMLHFFRWSSRSRKKTDMSDSWEDMEFNNTMVKKEGFSNMSPYVFSPFILLLLLLLILFLLLKNVFVKKTVRVITKYFWSFCKQRR